MVDVSNQSWCWKNWVGYRFWSSLHYSRWKRVTWRWQMGWLLHWHLRVWGAIKKMLLFGHLLLFLFPIWVKDKASQSKTHRKHKGKQIKQQFQHIWCISFFNYSMKKESKYFCNLFDGNPIWASLQCFTLVNQKTSHTILR